ncbi:SIR2-like domain-containing protein [Nitrosospira sp. Nsp18]|uniref:SIR2 family protein n=1 Tax=Nitrosospira sp. Nsp18 TaxID=1855334 RepID=UPI000887EA4D|nr:SIR2 family protein [Nitrosospira sp. Nsp18]SDA16715.1 SIR2-like domain-containing protein [Nitrosospira sp. Nsp18]
MENVLKNYPKAIVHLRQQFQNCRLSLVFGAGISRELHFPNWDELVEGIASHTEIDGKEIYENAKKWSNTTSITQLLFQHFKGRRLEELEKTHNSIAYREKRVLAEWREVVHEVLYKNAEAERKNNIGTHAYLKEFIPLINHTKFAVNYNFDDTLEYMLSQNEWNRAPRKGRAYQAVWNSHVQYQETTPVIYHPNGFLPGDKNLQQSENLVFSEDTFSDQLIESMSGRLASLLHLFTKKTCLFVGLSLDDHTLKHLLRQALTISPGNYHYYIRYTNEKKTLTASEKRAIFNSNFEVFNLITLFLNSAEVSALAQLIELEKENFKRRAAIAGVNTKYNYYLVGAVGVGKSTVLNHFGSLRLYEEWMEERPSALAKPSSQLTMPEKEMVDKWVNSQFYQKNVALLETTEGIQLIDRSPLDPITFTQQNETGARAQSMISAISPGRSEYKIESGQIVLLMASIVEVKSRLLSKRKMNWDDNTLEGLQKRTLDIYGECPTSAIDNTGRPIEHVVRAIAKKIFVEEYLPVDLHQRLLNIAEL